MRIVVDTNVLVSGLLSPAGPPGQIVALLLAGRVRILVDERVFAEYADVLHRPELRLRAEWVAALLEFLADEAEIVDPGSIDVDLPDPDDAAFLIVAVAGGADFLVTGNKRHFPARSRGGVTVVSPREFLARAGEQR